ncbi:MAG: hypothetical protein FWC59_03360 [Actinomycetia bacterium]|nr:hypothetical protein [Actinomycetes bacterium]
MAWAAGGTTSSASAAPQVTLQIVFGLATDGTPNVALNQSYEFTAGQTVVDLLDQAVAAGDIQAYTLKSGFPQSFTSKTGVTLTNSANLTTYWSTTVNNVYYAGTDNLSTMMLTDGTYYQFAWDSYPTAVAPDWNALAAPTDETGGTIAGGGSTVAGSATLTIVYGIDSQGWIWAAAGQPAVLINETYDFSAGATMQNLLDCMVSNWYGLVGYGLNSYGYLDYLMYLSRNLANAADFSTYWALYVDGVAYAGSDNIATLPLQDGHSYQLAWVSWPTAAPPDWATLGAPTPVPSDPGGGTTPPVTPPAAYNEADFGDLFNNIAASYAGTGADWQAMELAAIGRAGSVDQAAIIANAVEAYNNPDTTNLQRSIIALTALGLDATQIISNGVAYNLVDKLANTQLSVNTLNGQIFALLAYKSGSYPVPAGALANEAQLISNLLAARNADGGWSFMPGTSDVDMTAMAIAALAPYRADSNVEAALQQALTTLRAMQLPNGGFGSAYDVPADAGNVGSTAMAIIALCAAGVDAQTWTVGSALLSSGGSDATPLTALLAMANSTKTGFLYNGATNAMFTEQGFRAMVAYQGYLNTGQAYNVYLQAALGQAGLRSGTNGGNSTTGGGGSNSGLARTSDSAVLLGVLTMALLAVGLGICSSVWLLRRRPSRPQQ